MDVFVHLLLSGLFWCLRYIKLRFRVGKLSFGFGSHAWFAIIVFSNFDVATWRYSPEQIYRFMVYVWPIRFMHIFNLLTVVIVLSRSADPAISINFCIIIVKAK